MNKNDQEFIIQKIRTQYTEKEHTTLDELKKLDTKVKRPANVFAYIFGCIGAIVMGGGMSLVMTDIGDFFGLNKSTAMLTGIITGVVGIFALCIAYPVYNRIVKKERKKIAPEIIRLTDELTEQKTM
ncbi:MAG: hypothetical protein IKK37_04485 [Clostridia bacterium]|nr:hypothetical protein [Clostridia bacterium]